MLKKIFLSFLLIIGIIGLYSFVFGSTIVFDNNIKLVSKLSSNIFLDSEDLNSTILVFSSESDISDYELHSSCEIKSNFINNYDNLYFFNINYIGLKCKNGNLVLKYKDNLFGKTNIKLNIKLSGDLFDFIVDYDTPYLSRIRDSYKKEINKLAIFNNYDGKNLGKYYKYLKKQRKYKEENFKLNLINNILLGRKNKYIVPIDGYKLSNKYSKIPNSSRNYRSDYTDGIHHGWDIDTDFGEEIIALDDGLIVRVVNNFDFSDLSKIKKGNNLTYEEKLRNLDILRGNQVWLKTTKGDIVFYSHLSKINSFIEEGFMVKSGTSIGAVGVSGIPDKAYNDYHLHFPIHKNPYNKNKIGDYSIVDYMKWDWEFKGKTSKYIIENQGNIFET